MDEDELVPEELIPEVPEVSTERRRTRTGLPLLFVFLGIVIGIIGTLGALHFREVVKERESISVAKELTEEQINIWLTELDARLAEYNSKKQDIAKRLNETKRIYNILRNVEGRSKDDPDCLQYVKEAKILQGATEILTEVISRLSELKSRLQKSLRDIQLKRFVITPDAKQLVTEVKKAIVVDEKLGDLKEGARLVPDKVWEKQDPDEFMKE